ncbi:gp53-like domain-containing protein [Escherichia coli]
MHSGISILLIVQLGEAAKRNVGTAVNQIPDMSNFSSGSNWFQLPSGHIVQMFYFSVYGADASGSTYSYPIAFPSALIAASAMWIDGGTAAAPTFKIMSGTSSRNQITIKSSATSGIYTAQVIAIGR